jgi:hypothetical protein
LLPLLENFGTHGITEPQTDGGVCRVASATKNAFYLIQQDLESKQESIAVPKLQM